MKTLFQQLGKPTRQVFATKSVAAKPHYWALLTTVFIPNALAWHYVPKSKIILNNTA